MNRGTGHDRCPSQIPAAPEGAPDITAWVATSPSKKTGFGFKGETENLRRRSDPTLRSN